jgi:hypothetical protein
LEETQGMQESYARNLVTGKSVSGRFRQADREAYNAADHVVQRIESRCSKIEG